MLATNSGLPFGPAIKLMIEVMGEDRVMYAMDYPYQYVPDEVRWMDDLDITRARRRSSSRPTPSGRSAFDGPASAPPRPAWRGRLVRARSLVIVQAMSLLDRQVLAILVPRISADLSVGDAEMGLLYGTVFALFYAVFSLPLGRLADGWVRTTPIRRWGASA